MVLLTAAVRDLHKCFPNEFLTAVDKNYPEIWANNPYITPCEKLVGEIEIINCSYPLIHHSNALPRHAVEGFTSFLSSVLKTPITPTAFGGDFHLSPVEKEWASQVQEIVGLSIPFWIVVAGGKLDVTIKWWSHTRYQQVVDAFRGRIQFVQIGLDNDHHPKLEGVIDLCGKTSLRQLIRLVYHSQGVLCPVSLAMHLAAAVEMKEHIPKNRPCVVVAGGREPSQWVGYPHHQVIFTNGALLCCDNGGCWKSRILPLGDGSEHDKLDHLCVDLIRAETALPRCMAMITAGDVIRRIEMYFEGGAVRYLYAQEAEAAERAVYEGARVGWSAGSLEHMVMTNASRKCLAAPELKSPDFPPGCGIVICAGGIKYFTCAWITVKMLRKLGCRLPIELWHLGPEEMTEQMRALAGHLDVTCVDAHEVRKRHPARRLHGWELKCYAILRSRFREVLLMDADNVPARNPRYLFNTPEYKETGAVFWPDIGSMGPEKEIWKITGVSYDGKRDFESGQILVDKKRCWKALNLAMHYNEHSDFYYQYIYGDKDTFRFAFLKTGTPFSMPERGIEFIDGTLCQHDFEGRRVFQHRIKKWSFGGKNPRTPGFLHEEACLEYLEELRARWQTGLPLAAGPKAQLIPRILHRIWLGPEPLTAEQERWAETWRKHHPEWECKVWTAETVPVLINRPEFDGAREAQQRLEIASYEVLHQYGGVYVDADFECLCPLDGLLAGEECVIGEEAPGRVCHGLLAGVPGHEFFKHLTRSVRNSLRDRAGQSPVEQTGANFVTRLLRDRWDVTVLPPHYFHPQPHAAAKNGKRLGKPAHAYGRHHPSPRWAPVPEVVYERRMRQYSPQGKTRRERAAARALTRGGFRLSPHGP